jgi:hypothetical protein
VSIHGLICRTCNTDLSERVQHNPTFQNDLEKAYLKRGYAVFHPDRSITYDPIAPTR